MIADYFLITQPSSRLFLLSCQTWNMKAASIWIIINDWWTQFIFQSKHNSNQYFYEILSSSLPLYCLHSCLVKIMLIYLPTSLPRYICAPASSESSARLQQCSLLLTLWEQQTLGWIIVSWLLDSWPLSHYLQPSDLHWSGRIWIIFICKSRRILKFTSINCAIILDV